MPTLAADQLTIHTVRETKVILNRDLARLYGVLTKRLNEATRRNADRFPTDFCFQLTHAEVANLKSQIATSSGVHGFGGGGSLRRWLRRAARAPASTRCSVIAGTLRNVRSK
jgi:hypothetical protein